MSKDAAWGEWWTFVLGAVTGMAVALGVVVVVLLVIHISTLTKVICSSLYLPLLG